MSRWEGLDEFVAVAEIGSFSRAAERLRVSSSHVSRQVALLEERLQARLLYRTTRRVSLTEAGQTFFARCQRLIEERDEAFLTISDLQSAPSGLLRPTPAGEMAKLHSLVRSNSAACLSLMIERAKVKVWLGVKAWGETLPMAPSTLMAGGNSAVMNRSLPPRLTSSFSRSLMNLLA